MSPSDREARPKPARAGIPRLSRLRAGRWVPLLLLALSLGIAGAAIFQAQDAVRSHRATAEGLLRDYAAFAAWSYRQHAAEQIAHAFHRTLDPVLHPERHRGAPPPLSAVLAALRDTVEISCNRGVPPVPYVFRLGPADELPVFAGSAPPPAVQRWLAAALRPGSAPAESHWEGNLLSAVVGGEPRHVLFAEVKEGPGKRAVYGYELDPARYRPLFQAVLTERPLLPASLLDGRGSDELLAVRVVAPSGAALFETDAGVDWSPGSVDTLPAGFGGLQVHATVRPEAAGSLVIGGLPRSRLPWLLGLLALSVGLAAVAVYQLRREGELARLRSDFVSSVSHELRTPLAQVRLFLETLRLGRYNTDEQREWLLDNIDRETVRLTGLVDNVLHFSRAERGNTGGDRETVELAEYLAQVADAFVPLARSRRVRLETELEPGLLAPLHRESFRQVLLNLLDNAVKYGPVGQTVRISARAAGGRVRIAVEDEGPGVAPRERERIWEPFRRGERAIGSVAVGSGIGLSVVREIVEWHGGRAWVEEAEGGGARFVLEIPGWSDAKVARGEPADVLQRAG